MDFLRTLAEKHLVAIIRAFMTNQEFRHKVSPYKVKTPQNWRRSPRKMISLLGIQSALIFSYQSRLSPWK